MKHNWTVLLFVLVAAFTQAQAQRVATHGGVPVVSRDGSHIAFLLNRGGADELFVISADGTGEVQLTNTPDEKGALAWMPDGKRIAFQSNRTGQMEVWVTNTDGSGPRQITR